MIRRQATAITLIRIITLRRRHYDTNEGCHFSELLSRDLALRCRHEAATNASYAAACQRHYDTFSLRR